MRRRSGFTLIEVLAALALLSTTTVVLLAAQQRGLQRMTEAREREAAARHARRLIADWRLQPKGVRPGTEGSVPENRSWRWRRVEEPLMGTNGEHRLRRVTLFVFHEQEGSTNQPVAEYVWMERIDAR